MTVSGTGYTPNSVATLTLDGTTSAADTDATGAFSTQLIAPTTSLKHPGAQQFALSTRDVDTGAEATTNINVAKLGVDAFPLTAKPHARITWYLAGFPSLRSQGERCTHEPFVSRFRHFVRRIAEPVIQWSSPEFS